MMDTTRHTCLRLDLRPDSEPVFVKGTWYHSHFDLSITDGLNAWSCRGSEEEVKERASQWDQPVSEYIQLAESCLGFQHPGSVYGFNDAGNGHKRLSWTFEREGTKLEWRWKCQPSSNSKKTTAGILDFLVDANIRLSFLRVLNSKKAKLRELLDRLSRQGTSGKLEENWWKRRKKCPPNKTESLDERSDDEKSGEDLSKYFHCSSKNVPESRPRGRKRK